MRSKIVFSLVFLMSSVVVSDFANAQTKSYKLGYKWAAETDSNTLVGYGLLRHFDISGKPIKSKVTNFCNDVFGRTNYARVNNEGLPSMNKKDWVKGCVAKIMTYRI
jgi:hypothetical protein